MRAPIAALCACACACGGEVDTLGLRAWLRVAGGVYHQGALPAAAGGPAVGQAFVSRTEVIAGQGDRSLRASLAADAAGALVGLDGDAGYWVLPAGPPDVQEPGSLTLDAALSFSSALPPGARTLWVQATGADGRAGAPLAVALQAVAAGAPPAALSITLSWDAEADLDLHVVTPDGAEIFWDHVSAGGGLLDADSNQSCAIDGLRRERATWAAAPPAGRYAVRVDTPSLCGQATARWTLLVEDAGGVRAQARGQSIASDTRGAHGRGAGLLALELDLP